MRLMRSGGSWLVRLVLSVLVSAGLLTGARAAEGPLIFAAASLRDAMADIAALYPGEVAISLAGSGTLARQIDAGAPADLVFLANTDWMDWLESEGLVDPASRAALVGNALVLVAPSGTPDLEGIDAAALLARLDGGRMAIGQTQSVPAGIYGRAWLEAAGLWGALQPHLAQTDNVRAALALVARGEAPLGVVYVTDAVAEPGVRVVYEVPEDTHAPIVYPAAVLSEAGQSFMEFLQGEQAREVFLSLGFKPLTAAP